VIKIEDLKLKSLRISRKLEERTCQEHQEKNNLFSLVYEVRRDLECLKIEIMTYNEVKQHKVYMQSILENLKI